MSARASNLSLTNPAVVKLALLGDDPRAASLLRAFIDPLAGPPRMTLVGASAASRTLVTLRAAGFDVAAVESVSTLFAPATIDVAILAGDDAHSLDLARRLAAAGKPLLVVPLTNHTTAFAYELTLLQTDQATLLLPLFAWRAHPLVQQVKELLSRGALGTLQHVELKRQVLPSLPDGRVPSQEVANDFLEDIDLLRLLLGDIGNVTAIRVGDVNAGLWSQTVTLGSRNGVPATWSLAADADQSSWHLTLAATAGRVVLAGSPDASTLTCTVTGLPCATPVTKVVHEPGTWWRDRFLRTLQSAAGSAVERVDSVATADWIDYTRAFEILEGIERSLRRRRTIDLEFEVPSERSQFKTHMTATGCSLLILTLVAVVVFLLGAQLLGLSPPAKRASSTSSQSEQQEAPATQGAEEEGPILKRVLAVVVIFLPLGLFLALQIFYFIARPRPGPAAKIAEEASSPATTKRP